MAMIMTPFAHLFGSKFSFQNRNGIAKYALVWKHDSHSSIGIFAIPCPFWNDQTNITLEHSKTRTVYFVQPYQVQGVASMLVHVRPLQGSTWVEDDDDQGDD